MPKCGEGEMNSRGNGTPHASHSHSQTRTVRAFNSVLVGLMLCLDLCGVCGDRRHVPQWAVLYRRTPPYMQSTSSLWDTTKHLAAASSIADGSRIEQCPNLGSSLKLGPATTYSNVFTPSSFYIYSESLRFYCIPLLGIVDCSTDKPPSGTHAQSSSQHPTRNPPCRTSYPHSPPANEPTG